MKQSCYQQGCAFTMPCFNSCQPNCGCFPPPNPIQNFCGCDLVLPATLLFVSGVLIGCQLSGKR